MTAALDVADRLRALAERVRRNVPRRRDPERFHMEAHEIARALLDMAGQASDQAITDRVNRSTPTAAPAQKSTLGRTIVGRETVNGRTVLIQRRKSFAVHV